MFKQDVVIQVHVGTESPRPKDRVLLEALPLKGGRKSKIMSYIGSLKELGGLNLENKCLGSRKQCCRFNCSFQLMGMGLEKNEHDLLKIQRDS